MTPPLSNCCGKPVEPVKGRQPLCTGCYNSCNENTEHEWEKEWDENYKNMDGVKSFIARVVAETRREQIEKDAQAAEKAIATHYACRSVAHAIRSQLTQDAPSNSIEE